MRKSVLFLLSVFCFFLFPVAAQGPEYVITEAELIQLESISENLRVSRQNLLSQANALTERLQAQELKASSLTEKLQQAEQTANSLNSQLQTERESLTSLTESYNKYVKDTSETIAEKQALIDEQKDTLHRRMIAIIILTGILALIAVVTIAKYFLKYKFSLFRPP